MYINNISLIQSIRTKYSKHDSVRFIVFKAVWTLCALTITFLGKHTQVFFAVAFTVTCEKELCGSMQCVGWLKGIHTRSADARDASTCPPLLVSSSDHHEAAYLSQPSIEPHIFLQEIIEMGT